MDKLNFSDLLTLGSQQVPHCKRSMFGVDIKGERVDEACAVGMIAIGIAGTTELRACQEAYHTFQERVKEQGVSCRYLERQIIQWNDHHHLTPKQIAEKLKAEGL
jgi:hypothetical protein